ncbi:MAG TPA: methyltransferase domain-containing protein [Rhizomicrobium sp.]|jgi:SAM-dependent methyltransferase|nr:methyltransferase domain-containing protein [Rhizomicrobium sp.]
MPQDVRDLAAFYHAPMGQLAQRVIMRRLRALWPDLSGRRLLGYGYAVPYLRGLADAERAIAAMPAAMGVISWPQGRNAALLCEDHALPFPDVFFDRILVVHGLEGAEQLRPLLRQLWRVLAPEGRLMVVAPNRASLWAQVDISPFGQGRPFSRRELDWLLRDALFEPVRWECALYAPPVKSRALLGSGAGWEKIGARLLPRIGGVHLVEATKSFYAAATPALQIVKPVTLKAAGDLNGLKPS